MKDKLPESYMTKIQNYFGKKTNVSYSKPYNSVYVTPPYAGESHLTFDNYKFLADLFKTTKVHTSIYLDAGSGCPTCDGDSPSIDEVTFNVSEVIIEESNEK